MNIENKNINHLCQEIDKNIDILFKDLAYYKEQMFLLNEQNNKLKERGKQISEQLGNYVTELNALKAELKSIIEKTNNNAKQIS